MFGKRTQVWPIYIINNDNFSEILVNMKKSRFIKRGLQVGRGGACH